MALFYTKKHREIKPRDPVSFISQSFDLRHISLAYHITLACLPHGHYYKYLKQLLQFQPSFPEVFILRAP